MTSGVPGFLALPMLTPLIWRILLLLFSWLIEPKHTKYCGVGRGWFEHLRLVAVFPSLSFYVLHLISFWNVFGVHRRGHAFSFICTWILFAWNKLLWYARGLVFVHAYCIPRAAVKKRWGNMLLPLNYCANMLSFSFIVVFLVVAGVEIMSTYAAYWSTPNIFGNVFRSTQLSTLENVLLSNGLCCALLVILKNRQKFCITCITKLVL